MSAIEKTEEGVLLRVQLTPRSKRSQILGQVENCLRVSVNAPPHEGAANKALIKFIASALGIRASQVEIVSGHKSRQKLLKIGGDNLPLEIFEREA